jgi:hypothetical protein
MKIFAKYSSEKFQHLYVNVQIRKIMSKFVPFLRVVEEEKKHVGMQAGGEARLQGALPAPLLPLHSYSPVHQAVPRADQKGKQAYRTLLRWATGYLLYISTNYGC